MSVQSLLLQFIVKGSGKGETTVCLKLTNARNHDSNIVLAVRAEFRDIRLKTVRCRCRWSFLCRNPDVWCESSGRCLLLQQRCKFCLASDSQNNLAL